MMKRALLLLVACVALCLSTAAARVPMTVETIQQQLLEQPKSIADREETEEAWIARSNTMSRSLFDAAEGIETRMEKRWLVAAAIAIWVAESHFSLEVHQGGLTRWGSDVGKAKCFGQIHERSVGIKLQEGETLEEFRLRQTQVWESLVGTDYEATRRCAEATMRQFLGKLGNCAHLSGRDKWLGAFGDYGSGGASCKEGPTSEKRYNRMLQIVQRL